MPLSDTTIRNKAKRRGKPYKMSDEKGLYLFVSATGGKAGVQCPADVAPYKGGAEGGCT